MDTKSNVDKIIDFIKSKEEYINTSQGIYLFCRSYISPECDKTDIFNINEEDNENYGYNLGAMYYTLCEEIIENETINPFIRDAIRSTMGKINTLVYGKEKIN